MAGLTLDTNFNWAASLLTSKGITVGYHTSVSDNKDHLISSFKIASKRAKAVIVTGGLGPTEDDLSSISASEFLSSELVFNQQVHNSICEKLKSRGREPNENHKKQAMFPEAAETIENKVGTAWGFKFEVDGTWFYFLPGVPREFKPMFTEMVLPELESALDKNEATSSKMLKTFGLGESEVARRLSGLKLDGVDLGYRLKFPEVHLRLVTSGNSEPEVEKKFHSSIDLISGELGEYLFSTDEKTLEEATAELLLKKKITIATAESCTGGLLASRLTDIPGSSAYFLRGVITYSNEAKVEMLRVSEKDLGKYGAVSSQVVEQMAEEVRKLSGSDIGIGISGIAGPGGGTPAKPVGTVYIGFSHKDKGVFSKKYNFQGLRFEIKTISSSAAIDLVRKFCLNDV